MKASISWVAIVASLKLAPRRHFPTQYRKPDLYKRQPRRMHWQEVEREGAFRMVNQPGPQFSGPVRTDRVKDQVDGLVGWRLFVE
jgi:hypothetical protein